MACEKKNWSLMFSVERKISTLDSTVPVGNLVSLVSHWNGGPSGLHWTPTMDSIYSIRLQKCMLYKEKRISGTMLCPKLSKCIGGTHENLKHLRGLRWNHKLSLLFSLDILYQLETSKLLETWHSKNQESFKDLITGPHNNPETRGPWATMAHLSEQL